MPSVADRLDFFPPRPQGTGRALAVAVMAHLALLGALTWGVNWNREATVTTMEAELWSSLPQQAAPKLQEAAPAPPAPPLPEPPAANAPDIAVEKQAAKPAPKPPAQPEVKPPPKPAPKVEAKVDKAAEAKKLAQQEGDRQKHLERVAGLAGASGAPAATGQSIQSASISAAYGARIRARVLPNHVFTGDTSSNPKVEIQISADATGLIRKTTIVKSSGNRMFDESVVRAFEETQMLPRDENGHVPPTINITWSANRN